jgi:hypothetical protein
MATATVASETAIRRAVGYIRVSQERNARNGYGLAAALTNQDKLRAPKRRQGGCRTPCYGLPEARRGSRG